MCGGNQFFGAAAGSRALTKPSGVLFGIRQPHGRRRAQKHRGQKSAVLFFAATAAALQGKMRLVVHAVRLCFYFCKKSLN